MKPFKRYSWQLGLCDIELCAGLAALAIADHMRWLGDYEEAAAVIARACGLDAQKLYAALMRFEAELESADEESCDPYAL